MSKVQLTIQFKPAFELKLKRLGIKGKFVKNMRDYIRKKQVEYDALQMPGLKCHIHAVPGLTVDISKHRVIDSAIYLNSRQTWRQFVIAGFDWWNSNEGQDYWNEIGKH